MLCNVINYNDIISATDSLEFVKDVRFTDAELWKILLSSMLRPETLWMTPRMHKMYSQLSIPTWSLDSALISGHISTGCMPITKYMTANLNTVKVLNKKICYWLHREKQLRNKLQHIKWHGKFVAAQSARAINLHVRYSPAGPSFASAGPLALTYLRDP